MMKRRFFLYIIPLFLNLSFLSYFFERSVSYTYRGETNSPATVYGFPFYESGQFYHINGQFNTGDATSNVFNFFINQIILFTVSVLIYFLLKRIIKSKTIFHKIAIVVFNIIAYSLSLWYYYRICLVLQYNVGIWPDEIITNTYSYELFDFVREVLKALFK